MSLSRTQHEETSFTAGIIAGRVMENCDDALETFEYDDQPQSVREAFILGFKTARYA